MKRISIGHVVLMVILFLLTPTLLMGMYLVHPSFEIGVVLVDNIDESYGEIVKEGYDHYDEYFESKILPVRFTTEDVRNNGPYFLISDFFEHGQPERMCEEYDVDIIIFVTHHQINNWDEGGGGYCGEAKPDKNSALMTVYDFMGGGKENERIIKHIALHETFHVLGYTHNTQDRSGIMQYDTNIQTLDLVPFYEFQLPARSYGFWLINGLEFGAARILYQGIFAMVMMPMMIVITASLLKGYDLLFWNDRGLKWLILIIPILLFMILIIVESFRYLIFLSLPVLLIPVFYHLYKKGIQGLFEITRNQMTGSDRR